MSIQNSIYWKETEFLSFLESKNIDTALLMGGGYYIEDVKVGSTFYFSYSFIGRNAKQNRNDALAHCLYSWYHLYPSRYLYDKYKIIQKYEFKNIEPRIEFNNFKSKYRKERVIIQNVRTKEKIQLNNDEIDSLNLCIFDNID